MTAARDPLNAFLDLPQVVVSHAQSGPLAGLSLAVKDIFDVAGHVTGCGNPGKTAEGRIAERTAPAVQIILDAGARFAGKTQTDELAFSLFGQNSHFPHPVNPAAPSRVTGGSSSGSVAAVAGGLADIATGSDTGGSIRAPASFCGLVGLRTTHGAISLDATMPLAPSLDTFGWFARDIATYEKVGEVLLGPLPSPLWGGSARSAGVGVKGDASLPPPRLDRLASQAELADPPHRGEGKARPLRLAALDALVFGAAEAAEYRRMASVVAQVLGEPRQATPLAHSIDNLYWCFRRIQAFEAWAAHGAWISERDRELGPGVKERFAFGSTIDLATYAAETSLRRAFRAELADLLGDDGILVLPTVPGAAPRSDSTPDQFQAYREQALRLLCWSGLSGFPQITLPLGSIEGAPFGVSLLGPAGSDMALIRLGRRILEAAGKD